MMTRCSPQQPAARRFSRFRMVGKLPAPSQAGQERRERGAEETLSHAEGILGLAALLKPLRIACAIALTPWTARAPARGRSERETKSGS